MTFIPWIGSWGPVGAWAGLIYYLSSIPKLSTGLGVWDLLLRKGAHIFEYGVLTYLTVRAARRTWPAAALYSVLIFSAFFAVAYAASDEFHQSFVPGRGPSVVDVLIDSAGVLLCNVVLRKIGKGKNELW